MPGFIHMLWVHANCWSHVLVSPCRAFMTTEEQTASQMKQSHSFISAYLGRQQIHFQSRHEESFHTTYSSQDCIHLADCVQPYSQRLFRGISNPWWKYAEDFVMIMVSWIRRHSRTWGTVSSFSNKRLWSDLELRFEREFHLGVHGCLAPHRWAITSEDAATDSTIPIHT